MNRVLFIAGLGLFAVLFGTYLFLFLRRMSKFYRTGVRPPCATWGAVLLSAIFVIAAALTRGILLMILLFLTVFGLLTDLLNLIIRLIGKFAHRPFAFWQKLYRCGVIPVLITVIVATAGYFNMTTIHRTDYTVESPKLSRNYRIAYLSDLHFGTTMGTDKLQKIAGEISRTSPDMVILGGDITDESTKKEEMTAAFKILGGIKNNYGCFYVYGNHDRQGYSEKKHFTDTELQQAIEDAGIVILRDGNYSINGELLLIGREDAGRNGGQRNTIEALTAGTSEDMFRLVLDHQPRDTKEGMMYGCDLQLSGHTHNGQIWPIGYVAALSNDVLYGEKTLGTYRVIVSSGIGGWGFPVRTEGRSEWVMITLTPQPSQP